jgi:hypothetical protein
MLVLADGTFSPWLLCYSVGARWRTRGSSPRSLGGVWHSFKVLFAASSLCKAFISAGLGDISAGLGGAVRMYRCSRAFGACPGGVASRRAPEPGPIRGDWGGLSDFSVRPLTIPPQDGGARCLQLPSSGSRITGSSSSCYRVVQVDAHAPVR